MKINVIPSTKKLADAEREKCVAEPGFGKYFTDHMVVAEWNQNSGWSDVTVKNTDL